MVCMYATARASHEVVPFFAPVGLIMNYYFSSRASSIRPVSELERLTTLCCAIITPGLEC